MNTPSIDTVNSFIKASNDLMNISKKGLSPVETGDKREALIIKQLKSMVSIYGKKTEKPLINIDARGEIMFSVKGEYGEDLAKMLSTVPRRTGMRPYDGPVLPGNIWSRLNHFDAERLIYNQAKEYTPISLSVASSKKGVPGKVFFVSDLPGENDATEVLKSYIDEFELSEDELQKAEVISHDTDSVIGSMSYDGLFTSITASNAFEVYQIRLSKEDVEILELSDGWDVAAEKSPKISSHLDLMGAILTEDNFREKLEGNISSYEYSVSIEANDIDEAFRIGNDPSSRNADSDYHSLSVGDILFKEDSKSWHLILSVGFVDISEEFGKELSGIRNNELFSIGLDENIKDASFTAEIGGY